MSLSVSDVSIITVNWNGKEHLRALLPSLVPLGCREIIVVDNGSTDGSSEFLRRDFPGVRLLQNEANQGFAQPVNRAAEVATGSVLALINNDMRAEAGWIENGLRHFDETCPCVASRILDWEGRHLDYGGSSLQYLGYALQRDLGKLAAEVTWEGNVLFPCGGAMLVTRPVFLALGGFDPDFFAIFEDVDFGWRLWLSGHVVRFARDSTVYHRGHATFERVENEKVRYLMHRNALLTILKNYDEETFRKIFPLAIILAIRRAVRLSGVQKEGFYLWKETRHGLETGDSDRYSQLLDSFNHLVAVSDVLDQFPALLQKRMFVQGLRKRRDGEIIAMFSDPLRTIVEDPELIETELEYLHMLDLASLFDARSYQAYRSQLVPELQLRIDRLRGQLKAIEWLGVSALADFEPPPHTPLKRFLRECRVMGFSSALRGLAKRIRRAV